MPDNPAFLGFHYKSFKRHRPRGSFAHGITSRSHNYPLSESRFSRSRLFLRFSLYFSNHFSNIRNGFFSNTRLCLFLFAVIRKINISGEEVLHGIRLADNAILKRLYSDNYPVIRKLVLTNSGNEHDAKDILQDGIEVLCKKSVSREFKLTCSVTTYLYSVCKNIWLKELRGKQPTVRLTETHFESITVEGDFETNMELTERQQLLYRLLEQEGEVCKNLLELYYIQKMPLKEIAVKMKYANMKSAKTQKYKCLKKLRAAAKNFRES